MRLYNHPNRPGQVAALVPIEDGIAFRRFSLEGLPGFPDDIPSVLDYLEAETTNNPERVVRHDELNMVGWRPVDPFIDRAVYLRAKLKAMPGWGSWTLEQAEAYIDGNVVDPASTRLVLKRIAALLVHLRDASL